MITEKLTKLDVARRQTDEAIRMFFDRRDTVATHTVAAAAAQVLADLGGHYGFKGWSRNKAIINPEHWKRWRDAVTRFERFFKHADDKRADNDAHATCDFHPEATRLILIESVELLRRFTGKVSWEGFLFACWFSIKYPEVLLESEFKAAITAPSVVKRLDVDALDLWADLLRARDSLPPSVRDDLLK